MFVAQLLIKGQSRAAAGAAFPAGPASTPRANRRLCERFAYAARIAPPAREMAGEAPAKGASPASGSAGADARTVLHGMTVRHGPRHDRT